MVGAGDGLGIGAALTGPNPNINVDMPTPAAIAAALATRFRFIGFCFPRRRYVVNVLVTDYPGNAETNPATPRNDVPIGINYWLEGAPTCRAARENSTGQCGAGWAGAARGHCGR